MRKLTVAALVIGAFVLYSFLHAQPSGAVLNPPTSADAASTAATTPAATTAAPPPPASAPAATDPPSTGSAPTSASTATTAPTPATASGGRYKNGSYTGTQQDAQWGYIQVKATVSQGKITDVQFLQYPNDRSRSVYINGIADPMLKSEAIQAQSAQVDIITGATDSSEAFIQSLSDALSKAQA